MTSMRSWRVELQIAEVRGAGPGEATATVRNLRGPVRRGARFDRLSGSAAPVDLVLARIVRYGREVDEIPAGHTALVTLSGPGAGLLRPALSVEGSGWTRLGG